METTWLVDFNEKSLSNDEQRLVAKARIAASKISRRFVGQCPDGYRYDEIAGAVIWPDPLRIDFRAYTPGETAQAFIGPQELLTDALFEGDAFCNPLLEKLESGFVDYDQYCKAFMA